MGNSIKSNNIETSASLSVTFVGLNSNIIDFDDSKVTIRESSRLNFEL